MIAILRERALSFLASDRLRLPALVLPLLLIALSVFAYEPLLRNGLIATGDIAHAFRVYEMEKCLDDGQIPCRWSPDLGNGHGQPLFNYYSPLPYYVGAVLHDLGFSYFQSVSALFVIGLVGAGLSMFVLARRLWGDLGGLVSAVAYVYAPYLALDVYLRGALAELWGFAVVPALLWAVHELIITGRRHFIVLVALLAALLLLSHQLVAVIVAPAVAVWAAVLLATQGKQSWRPAVFGGIAALWGFGLAAFFVLPVLFEGDLIRLDKVARNLTDTEFLYSSAFANVSDLFFLRSGDYSWLLGQRDAIPLQIGWFHWALALLALPAGALFFRAGRRNEWLAVATFALAFGIGVFMAVSASRFIWDSFDSLRFLQFPYRYLGLVSLASATLAGAWLGLLRSRPVGQQLLATLVLAGVFIGTGETFFNPYVHCTPATSKVLFCPGSDVEYFSPKYVAFFRMSGIEAYLPTAVEAIPFDPPASAARVTQGDASIDSISSGSDWLEFSVQAATPSQVEASIFDYPNWRVRVDGETVPHNASAPYGLITFDVPAGRHDIELRLEDTGVRTLGNRLSFVSWALLALAGVGLAATWLRDWGTRLRAA